MGVKGRKLFRTQFIANDTNLDQTNLRKLVFTESTLEEAHSSGHARGSMFQEGKNQRNWRDFRDSKMSSGS